jgi:exportin-1
MEPNQNIQYL